jgi:molecular chaperone HtpG
MIHSLYSNKEIFLRELISNASDACDKLRFEALNNAGLYGDDSDLKIRVSFDKEARTLTIADNGIGLSRDEAVEHLGTIAKSGTREFFSALTGDQAKDAHLIGQFGVGFYSSYIVADKVTVVSRRAGLEANQACAGNRRARATSRSRWSRRPAARYRRDPAPARGRGRVPLELESARDRCASTPTTSPADPDEEGEWDEEKKEQVGHRRRRDGQPGLGAVGASEVGDHRRAVQGVLQARRARFRDPLAYVHARVEGKQEYTQLLYIPSRAPFDMFDRNARHGIKLYVRRVFIMDDAEQLMPLYLRFVRGVVDSNDLPLNVSREILQQSRDIETIRGGCVKKVLGLLEGLADSDEAAEKEKYAKFWKEFGRVLKEGVGEDFANKERIAKLLRFASTQADTPDEKASRWPITCRA